MWAFIAVELPQLLFPQGAFARNVVIFKSTLLKTGAEYEPLHTVELACDDRL